RLPLDVVGGVKEQVAGLVIEALVLYLLARANQAGALEIYPVCEFWRGLRQRPLCARDPNLIVPSAGRDELTEPVGRRDHLVVGIGRNGRRVVFLLCHDGSLSRSAWGFRLFEQWLLTDHVRLAAFAPLGTDVVRIDVAPPIGTEIVL